MLKIIGGEILDKIDKELDDAHDRMDVCFIDCALLRDYQSEREIEDVRKDAKAAISRLKNMFKLLDDLSEVYKR